MNAQGDVIALLDENYNVVVKYTYDTWGKVLSVTNASGTLITDTTHIGHRNPIRYRGYYYDIETELYYLQSRYYDPEVGRFISADAFLNSDITGNNIFIYCSNNPVCRADTDGEGWNVLIGAIIGSVVSTISQIVTNVASEKDWSDGIIGAFVGGGVSGALSAMGMSTLASYAGAHATSFTNELCSYIPKIAEFNGDERKKLTMNNVKMSFSRTLFDAATEGTKSLIVGSFFSALTGSTSFDFPNAGGFFKDYIKKSGVRSSSAMMLLDGGLETNFDYVKTKIIANKYGPDYIEKRQDKFFMLFYQA